MSARVAARPPRTRWFWPVALVGGAALLLFLGLFALDYSLQRPQKSLLRLIFTYDPETAQNALGNLAQVVVAVLGLVVTVVSIVVQLAANRYTPRITDLFFRDRTNLLVLGFFVTTSIAAVWVSLSVERDFVPERAITGTLLLVTLSLLLVIPYFGYVFDFLDPEAVIARIRDAALRHAADGSEEPAHIEARQRALLLRVTQLGDIAVNAVGNRDKIIATSVLANRAGPAGSSTAASSKPPPAAPNQPDGVSSTRRFCEQALSIRRRKSSLSAAPGETGPDPAGRCDATAGEVAGSGAQPRRCLR